MIWINTDEVIDLAEKVKSIEKEGFTLDFMKSISSLQKTHKRDTWPYATKEWIKKKEIGFTEKQFKIYQKIKLLYK